MSKNKEIRKPLKKLKIIDGFESAGYEVVEWYLDPLKNSCKFILIKHKANNIEFLCTISDTFHLPCDEGIYIYLDQNTSPDIDDATSMWNECSVDKLFLQIQDKVILKTGKGDYDVYSCRNERPTEDDIATLERFAHELTVLNDDSSSEKTTKVIMKKKNPFDILIDGGTFEKVNHVKVEDVQPCILVEYNGYSMGQAIPVIDFTEFFNKEDIASNINNITKSVKEIYNFQNEYIKKLFEEAIDALKKFTNSIETSYEEYNKSVEQADKDFNIIQSILEKQSTSTKVNDIAIKANKALRELLVQQIEKRDAIIGLLEDTRIIFGKM